MSKQFPDVDWNLEDANGNIGTWDGVKIAVLMDIRRELKALNRLLMCPNFVGIPSTLRRISSNTAKPSRKPAPKRKRRTKGVKG